MQVICTEIEKIIQQDDNVNNKVIQKIYAPVKAHKGKAILDQLTGEIQMMFWRMMLCLHLSEVGRSVRCSGMVRVKGTRNIKIGDHGKFGKNIILKTEGRGYIHIGSGVTIGDGVKITSRSNITIEDNAVIGSNVEMDDFQVNGAQIAGARPIYISKDVHIEKDVIICPGITLGQRVHVPAGSVVSSSVPPEPLSREAQQR